METYLWHSSQDPDLARDTVRAGLHLGTRAQAEMRRPGGHLYLVKLKSGVRPKRSKDKPDWDRRTISRWSRRAKLVVYLNRYEGIPVESLPAAIKHDGASDAIFARHVAGSEDSYIVLDPDIIETIHRFDGNERPSL